MKINQKGDIEILDKDIKKFKEDIKKLVRLHMQGNMDAEIYNEEYKRFQDKLDGLRDEKGKLEKAENKKEKIKNKVDEIVEVLSSRDSLLTEFDDDIFNALVEKIEILEPTHLVFVLKSGMRVEKIIKCEKYKKY